MRAYASVSNRRIVFIYDAPAQDDLRSANRESYQPEERQDGEYTVSLL